MFDIGVSASEDRDGPLAVIYYSFRDNNLKKHNIRFDLWRDSRSPPGFFIDGSDALGVAEGYLGENPIEPVIGGWQLQCGVGEILITAKLDHLRHSF